MSKKLNERQQKRYDELKRELKKILDQFINIDDSISVSVILSNEEKATHFFNHKGKKQSWIASINALIENDDQLKEDLIEYVKNALIEKSQNKPSIEVNETTIIDDEMANKLIDKYLKSIEDETNNKADNLFGR